MCILLGAFARHMTETPRGGAPRWGTSSPALDTKIAGVMPCICRSSWWLCGTFHTPHLQLLPQQVQLIVNLLVRVLQVVCELRLCPDHGLDLGLQLGLGSMQLLTAAPA